MYFSKRNDGKKGNDVTSLNMKINFIAFVENSTLLLEDGSMQIKFNVCIMKSRLYNCKI